MKRGFLLIAVIIAGIFTGCQNYHLAKADRNYKDLQYHSAIDNYRKYLKSNDDQSARLKLVESCMKVNRFHEALDELGKIRQENDPSNYWLVKGRKLMEEAKYDSAEIAFKKFLEQEPKNEIAEHLCQSCNWISAQMQDTGYYEVSPVTLKGFNNYFSATHFKNGLIIAAGGERPRGLEAGRSENNYNLFYLEKDSTGNFKEPVALDGPVNGNYDETCPCVNPEDGQLVFTRGTSDGKKTRSGIRNNLKIFFADYKENGWRDLKEFPYNDQKFSVAHPSVAVKQQIFFFVSDKPGGMGGSDLYYSIMSGGGFSEPKNLGGAVNTKGNEMFPWYNENDSCLYFSSEGHNNFGGLDIYKVKFVEGVAGPVENLGFPVNSSKDDFSYLMNKDGKTGYFSSNRSGSDKLYQVYTVPPKVSVTGMITKDRSFPLEGTEVLITDETTGERVVLKTDVYGIFKSSLELGRSYKVEAKRPHYFKPQPVNISTVNIKKHKEFLADFNLTEIEFDKPVILDHVYYDINNWEVGESEKPALDRLIMTLNSNPEISIEINSHTDASSDHIYNLKLSEKRAKAVADYLVMNGISAERVSWKGFGETRLLNRCSEETSCSESDNALNRRTEFKVVKIKSDEEVANKE